MDLGKFFNSETLLPLALPAGIGLVIIVVTIVLRGLLYAYIHKLAAKTKTCFDDIMIHDTRPASLLWCIWLGIFTAYKIAMTPDSWMDLENQLIPVFFAALSAYTVIVIIMAVFKWYKIEVCPKTNSSLDDLILTTLIISTPIVGSALGLVLILNILGKSPEAVNTWLGLHGAKIGILTAFTIALLLLVIVAVPRFIERVVREAKTEQTEDEMKKRADTLISVFVATLQIVIIFMFIIMLLTELTINVTAVLTGAGVLGLAIGFGAQSLVKDLIAGLFVISENQYRKGDVVKIAGESGVVEEINLRRTILRDMDGGYHVVPNGEIRIATNFTKQMSKVNFNIGVSYDTNLEHAINVINNVGKDMAKDPVWGSSIISPPRALRVDNLGESSVDIKIIGETKPSRQWDVTGELRFRLKNAFDKEGIEIPYPHTHVIFDSQPPVRLSNGETSPAEKN